MKISVIVPCYNGEKYIWDCLTSVKRQKVDQIEVIVVNDGSRDHSIDILNKWNNSETPEITIVDTKNLGSAHARNRGVQVSTGEYIQFLDVDDILLESKLADQIHLIKQCMISPDIIAGSYKKVTDGSKGRIYSPLNDPWLGLITSQLGITSSNLFRRDTVLRVGGFNPNQKSSQEYELMFRMMCAKECLVISDPEINTIKRDVNPASISSSNILQNKKRHLELRTKIKDYIKNNIDDKSVYKCCENEIFLYVRKIYSLDKQAGINYFKKYIDDKYLPDKNYKISQLTLPKYYPAVYRYLGFRLTEILYYFVKLTKKILYNNRS